MSYITDRRFKEGAINLKDMLKKKVCFEKQLFLNVLKVSYKSNDKRLRHWNFVIYF